MNYRRQALINLINDEPTQVFPELFTWRGRHYQVIPYKKIPNLKLARDSFIKVYAYGKLFGVREMSENLLRKYYYAYYCTLDK